MSGRGVSGHAWCRGRKIKSGREVMPDVEAGSPWISEVRDLTQESDFLQMWSGQGSQLALQRFPTQACWRACMQTQDPEFVGWVCGEDAASLYLLVSRMWGRAAWIVSSFLFFIGNSFLWTVPGMDLIATLLKGWPGFLHSHSWHLCLCLRCCQSMCIFFWAHALSHCSEITMKSVFFTASKPPSPFPFLTVSHSVPSLASVWHSSCLTPLSAGLQAHH